MVAAALILQCIRALLVLRLRPARDDSPIEDLTIEWDNARAFHNVMQDVQLSRQRTGAYGWSVARDIADPELWTERYHCPTWLDYLRQRNRATQSERALHQEAIAFHIGPGPVRIRRMLERPFGSVRSKDHKIDTAPRVETTATRAAGPAIEAAPTARVIAWPKRT